MLTADGTKRRQGRLLEVVRARGLDAVVIGDPRQVYYFTSFQTNWLHQSCFVLLADGRSWVVTGNLPAAEAVADEKEVYDAQWMATQRSDQAAVVGGRVVQYLKSRGVKRVGVDASAVTSQVVMSREVECGAVDEEIHRLRRKKDGDELELIRRAIRCTEAMYRRAREVIRPGVPELVVFEELHRAGVMEAGELFSPQHLGNDFQSGRGGGPPRGGKVAQEGEIYVLDLGPAYRGYFADNCRAFSVDRKPTDVQVRAWEGIVKSLAIVEGMARPGVRCRAIFEAVDEHFKGWFGVSQKHHLGHGIGLQPHEGPHLNPNWDDVLEVGDVFTAEPGIYGVEINGGIRIEQDYLVTENGIECLVDYPLGLV
jgi:Xaa-Pro aminopeptidase